MINNPFRGRFNSWFFLVLDNYMHSKYEDIKSELFNQIPAIVVELGPGAGANLRYLPEGTHLIAIEPNRQMHAVLRQRAKQYGIKLDLHELYGEQLDLTSQSVDFIFSSLVLCSVNNPEKVIAEVRRVLRPGGLFVCIEHIKAPEGSIINRVQRIIKRPWMWVFEGCDLCRETASTIQSAGFSKVDIHPLELPTIFLPIRHQVLVRCIN